MEHVIASLTEQLPFLSPQLRRAADTLLENPGAIAVNSMRVMAGTAEVSPPTMLRLAQRLGFPSYEAFRDIFKDQVAGKGYGARAGDLNKATRREGVAGLVRDTADAVATGMARFHNPAFAFDVDRAAAIIAAAPRTFVIASGASFGQAVSFHYVCRMALPVIELASAPGLRAIDCLTSLQTSDAVLAIATSPYARSTIEAAEYARVQGARITAVTDSRSSPLGRIAEAAVILDTEGPHYFPSMIRMAATLEVLSATIAVKRGPDAVAAISSYERGIRDSHYYWEDSE